MKRVFFPNPASFLGFQACIGIASFWRERQEDDVVYLILSALVMSQAFLLFLSDPSQNYHNERNPLMYLSIRNKRTAANGNQLEVYSSSFRQFSTVSMKFCETCKLSMNEDTEHCTQCGVCISGFQNHCIYLSNCIGSSNKYLFYLFLSTLQIWNLSNLRFSITLIFSKDLSILPFLLLSLLFEVYLLALSLLKYLIHS
jgi:hypothetical protein